MTADVYTTEELREIALDSAAAIMKSNQIWVMGYHSIAHSMELATQARLEQRWATWNSITDAKSPYQAALEIQSYLVRLAFERSLTEAARLTATSLQVIGHTMQPMATYIARPAAALSLGA